MGHPPVLGLAASFSRYLAAGGVDAIVSTERAVRVGPAPERRGERVAQLPPHFQRLQKDFASDPFRPQPDNGQEYSMWTYLTPSGDELVTVIGDPSAGAEPASLEDKRSSLLVVAHERDAREHLGDPQSRHDVEAVHVSAQCGPNLRRDALALRWHHLYHERGSLETNRRYVSRLNEWVPHRRERGPV
jgi:hypothetical protein